VSSIKKRLEDLEGSVDSLFRRLEEAVRVREEEVKEAQKPPRLYDEWNEFIAGLAEWDADENVIESRWWEWVEKRTDALIKEGWVEKLDRLCEPGDHCTEDAFRLVTRMHMDQIFTLARLEKAHGITVPQDPTEEERQEALRQIYAGSECMPEEWHQEHDVRLWSEERKRAAAREDVERLINRPAPITGLKGSPEPGHGPKELAPGEAESSG
jgi:hypothetical protein